MFSIKGSVIYTGKDVVNNSFINFKERVIVDISTDNHGEIKGEYPIITPSFIDPHCHIGMDRGGEPSDESESNEKMDTILALADALDSVQMDDVCFKDSIEAGVLYSCILPGSGNILSGKSAIVRNYGKTTTDAFISRAGIKAAVGYNPMSTIDWKGKRPFTRMGALTLLREKLYAVKTKLEKKDEKKELTREDEILRDILYGNELLRIHVHKPDDIESILRIVDEFSNLNPNYNLRITIEHALDVNDIYIFNKLKERNIKVVYGPIEAFPYKVELKHESWKNVKYLLDSQVDYGLMTDHPVILQRMLFSQLRWFTRTGLNKQQAIQIISLNNAKVLGVDHILGSLESDKWASFVCWNGDPFDISCYPVAVYGEGKLLISG